MKSDKRKRPRRNGKAGVALILGLFLLGLAGCYGPTALERDFGQSVANNLAQQVANPRAGLDPTPGVGLSPKAGANEMEAYQKSFKAEEKKGIDLKSLSPM
jgi:hypothetical protein